MRSRLAATIVAANFSFGIPYAAGRPSAARDDRVSCIQPGYVRATPMPKTGPKIL